MPCILSVAKDIYQPRLPSYRLKKATADRPITIFSQGEWKGIAVYIEREGDSR